MSVCPECESVLDFDPDEVEEGDVVVCDECGTEFEVVAEPGAIGAGGAGHGGERERPGAAGCRGLSAGPEEPGG